MPTVHRPGPRVMGLQFCELITWPPSTLGSTAWILNTETVSQVLIYTVDEDVDGQEWTGMKKKIDRRRWGIGHGRSHCCTSCTRRCRVGGTPVGYPRWVWLLWHRGDVASSFCLPWGGSGWRRRWPFFLKLGNSVGRVSLVYLRRWGKHQWERRTPAILLGRLARRGRHHKGVAAAKMVARVWAQFGWGNPLGTAPYIGKLVPTTHKRCGLQSYAIFILILSRFSWRSQGTEGFPSRQRRELGSILVLHEDDGVLAGPAWAARWPLGHEVSHVKRKRWQSAWTFIKVLAHGQ
jgi:hypothetical protein